MASPPSTTYAEWLQAPALYVEEQSAAVAAAWGDDAPKPESVGPIARRADAVTEADRQLTFMGQAMVRESHVLKGRLSTKIGKTITVTIEKLGYDNGLDVIVLGANDDLATGLSNATVLRRV